jgi:hypothetical protein
MLPRVCAPLKYMSCWKLWTRKHIVFKNSSSTSTTVSHCSKYTSSFWSLRKFPPYITIANHKLGLFHMTVITAELLNQLVMALSMVYKSKNYILF